MYSSILGAEDMLSELVIPIVVEIEAEGGFAEPGEKMFDATDGLGSDGTHSAKTGLPWLEGMGPVSSQTKNLQGLRWVCLFALMRA